MRRIYRGFGISFLAVRSVLGSSRRAGVRRRSACGMIVLGLLFSGSSNCMPRRVTVIRNKGCLLAFVRGRASFLGSVGATLRGGILGVHDQRSSFLLDIVLGDIVTDFVSVVSRLRSKLRSLRRRLLSPRRTSVLNVRGVRRCHHGFHMVGGYVLPLGRRVDGLLRPVSGSLLRGTDHPFFGSIGSRLRFMLRALSNYHSVVSTLMSVCLSGGSQQVGDVVGRLAIISAVFVPLAFLTKV